MSFDDIRENAQNIIEDSPASDEAGAASAAISFMDEYDKSRRRLKRIREKLRAKSSEALDDGEMGEFRAYRKALDIIRETDGSGQ